MIKIAIVGNIASGKSTVSDYLESLGYKILDTDLVAHEILKNKSEQIIELFKNYEITDEFGKISRPKLAQLVFNNSEAKLKLEKFIHPQIKTEIEKFFDSNKIEKKIFVGIPLLFEAKMEDLFDKILFVFCNDNIRLKRLIKRNNYTENFAKIRMNSQIAQDEKVLKSDFVIYNNSTIDDLKKQINEFLKYCK